MELQLLAPFLLAVLLIQITPGPGMLFILANGIAGGPRAGIAAALGAATGMVFHTAAAAAGLAALFQAAPPIYDAVRLGGACYLLWLAADHFRSAGSLDELEPPASRSSTRRVYLRAIVNNLANPKVILFFVAFLPQFVAPDAGPPIIQFVILGSLFLLLGLVLDTILGVLSGRLAQTLRRRKWVTKLLDRIAGTILAGLGLRLALNDNRP